jgi:hypothetical protein
VNAVVLAKGSMQNALIRIKSKSMMRKGARVFGFTCLRYSDYGNALSLHIENVIRDATVIPLKPDINVTRIIRTPIPFTKYMFPLKTK